MKDALGHGSDYRGGGDDAGGGGAPGGGGAQTSPGVTQAPAPAAPSPGAMGEGGSAGPEGQEGAAGAAPQTGEQHTAAIADQHGIPMDHFAHWTNPDGSTSTAYTGNMTVTRFGGNSAGSQPPARAGQRAAAAAGMGPDKYGWNPDGSLHVGGNSTPGGFSAPNAYDVNAPAKAGKGAAPKGASKGSGGGGGKGSGGKGSGGKGKGKPAGDPFGALSALAAAQNAGMKGNGGHWNGGGGKGGGGGRSGGGGGKGRRK